ncbi:S1 RNA-binding domain-containing protein [bacterium]|nr:S1 RNA-binding domain-containing protein [bacterium]
MSFPGKVCYFLAFFLEFPYNCPGSLLFLAPFRIAARLWRKCRGKELFMAKTAVNELEKLMGQDEFLPVPKKGEIVKGKVLSTTGRQITIDIAGLMVGVVRGRELRNESEFAKDLSIGDEVEATVIEEENENGEVELSFRSSGAKRAWQDISSLSSSGEVIIVKVSDANKGGLIVKLGNVQGFLPVSQLAPEHYPRVAGGDKQKIFDKLKSFVGIDLRVRVLDMQEDDGKLIVSEKAVWEEEQKSVIAQCHVGDVIAGEVSAVADFGAFVKFFPTGTTVPLEGLVHISEIAWQRIDHPKDVIKLGDNVQAEIIGIEGSKIFLSMKKLTDDPWKTVTKRFKAGDWVEGKIIKVNPFGFFVELDTDIQGLAHVSELSDKPVEDPSTIGSVGDVMKFRIVSIEPNEHRLGLSLREEKETKKKADKAEKSEEKKA